jgi:MFS family permease
VLADVLCCVMVGAIPLLRLAGVLTFWQLLLLVFLLASANAPGDSARFALVPALAVRARMPRERANAADRAIGRLGQLVGPLIAGILIAVIGATNVLLVDAATYAFSAALVAVVVPAVASAGAEVEARRKRGYLPELLEGLRFVRTNALILSIILLATLTNFLDVPLVQVVLPVYARTFYGSAASLGLMLGALAAGALAGTLLFGAVGRRWPRRLTFLACFVTGPLLVYGSLAATPPLAVVVAAGALGGLIAGPINPLYETVIQERTPPPMLGRVFGTLNALAQAGIPFGAVLAGFAAEGLGVVPTIVGMGAIYLVATVGMFFNPVLRQMDAAGQP